MKDDSGTCGVNDTVVYYDGVLNRCTYDFGHHGKHSWERKPRYFGWVVRGFGSYVRDDGKLAPKEAEYLVEVDE